MTRILLSVFIAMFVASPVLAQATAPGDFEVTARTLNVRLAANTSGKVAHKLKRGQTVEVLEVLDGWARISRYYDGASEGQSGNVARWVFATHLSAKAAPQTSYAPAVQPPAHTRPTTKPLVKASRATKIDLNSPVFEAIQSSDDLQKHQYTFVSVSEKLVAAGHCKLSDFRDIGGWWRSAAHKPEPVYYTYCGGTNNEHRVYVNAATGYSFR